MNGYTFINKTTGETIGNVQATEILDMLFEAGIENFVMGKCEYVAPAKPKRQVNYREDKRVSEIVDGKIVATYENQKAALEELGVDYKKNASKFSAYLNGKTKATDFEGHVFKFTTEA